MAIFRGCLGPGLIGKIRQIRQPPSPSKQPQHPIFKFYMPPLITQHSIVREGKQANSPSSHLPPFLIPPHLLHPSIDSYFTARGCKTWDVHYSHWRTNISLSNYSFLFPEALEKAFSIFLVLIVVKIQERKRVVAK